MDFEEMILGLIEDANYHEAVEAYEKKKDTPITASLTLHLARTYHCLGNYEEALRLLETLKAYPSISETFEASVLELKERFLLDKDVGKSLRKVEALKKNKDILQQHIQVIEKLKTVVQARLPSKTLAELQVEAKAFIKIWEEETNVPQMNPLNWEGFPGYLIPKCWFDQWKKHVRITERELDRRSPGVISQFQILDHKFHHLQDPLPQKLYTNEFLFDTEEILVMPPKCWRFLSERYGGVAIERYSITNSSNVVETEVEIQKVEIEVKGEKPKFLVQLSRLSFWRELEEKLIRILGPGKLWKMIATRLYPIEPQKLLEDDDFSNFSLLFEKTTALKPKANNVEVCGNCGKTEKLKLCKDCRSTKYCNMDCLNAHRSKHEKVCKMLRKEYTELSNLSIKFNLSVSEPIRGKKGVVGLRNLGNTCYINSSLQCLSNTAELTNFFISGQFVKQLNLTNVLGSGGEVGCYYSKLLREIWTCSDSAVSAWELRREICKKFPQFAGYSQHDSSELLGAILDVLHEDTNMVKVKPPTTDSDSTQDTKQASEEAFSMYRLRNRSFISQTLTSQFKTTMVCPKCSQKRISFEHFTILPLPIPQSFQVELNLIRAKYTNCKLTFMVYPTNTVRNIVEALSRKYGIKCQDIRLFKLNENYTVNYEFQLEDDVQKLVDIGHDELNTCYEIPQSNGQIRTLYQVLFFDIQGIDKISYPRFITVPHNASEEQIKQSLKEIISIYCSHDRMGDKPFQWKIKDSTIEIYLQRNIFARQSYYSVNRLELEEKSHTLKDCFLLFSRDEVLDEQNTWYCKTCKLHIRAHRKMEVYRTNRVLIVSLKRYNRGKKIKAMIEYPVEGLDLKELGVQVGGTYDLYGVVNHYGTLINGHYTAYCKNFVSNSWYLFNDSKVSLLDKRDIVTDHAYILFYRLRS